VGKVAAAAVVGPDDDGAGGGDLEEGKAHRGRL